MKNHTRDMTTGSPIRHMLLFALPLLLGNITLQAYTATDAMIVSRFAGEEALGVLGSAEWLMWLVFSTVQGFMQGFAILVAQRFGAGDAKGLRRAAAMTVLLGAGIAALFTIAGLLSIRPLLRVIGTHERVFSMSVSYLAILYGGIAVVTAYHMYTSFLRALGNGRVPLIVMACSSVANILLDCLFIIVFQWGVRGAALGTILAQALGTLICVLHAHRLEPLKLRREDFRIDRGDIRKLLRLASPIASMNALISMGGMAVQKVINSLGFAFVAGFTATNKLYGILEVAALAFGFAIATFTGQNLGARRYDRIRTGVRRAALSMLAVSAAVAGLMFLFGGNLLAVMAESSEDTMVLEVAKRYLFIMSAALPILYLLHAYRSALQGMGNTVVPMASGMGECAMRVGVAWLLTRAVGADGIFFAEPAAWALAAAILMGAYFVKSKRFMQSGALTARFHAEKAA